MRIAISTGGGDCPGLNAVIRATVRTAVGRHGWEVVGIKDGLDGLERADGLMVLSPARVRDLIERGGTILGSTNKGNPFRYPVVVDGKLVEQDLSDRFVRRIRELGIDAVVFVGGDGTQTIAHGLAQKGLNVVGVPKTIDNDLESTDATFGFDTAVNVCTEALDRLRTTAASHDRVMILEVMGRYAGWIALHAGIAGDADVVVIPEIPYDPRRVLETIRRRDGSGIEYTLCVVAEGARTTDGAAAWAAEAGVGTNARLGGAGQRLAEQLLALRPDLDVRVTVLGHVQRGGTPSQFDRVLGTRLGVHAVNLIREGRFGRLAVLRGTEVVDVDIAEAAGRQRLVDPGGSLVAAARAVGISLGD